MVRPRLRQIGEMLMNTALSLPEAEKIIAAALTVSGFYQALQGVGVTVKPSPFNSDLMILRFNQWKVMLSGYKGDALLPPDEVKVILQRLGLLDGDDRSDGKPH
jgi:hypothetical protein